MRVAWLAEPASVPLIGAPIDAPPIHVCLDVDESDRLRLPELLSGVAVCGVAVCGVAICGVYVRDLLHPPAPEAVALRRAMSWLQACAAAERRVLITRLTGAAGRPEAHALRLIPRLAAYAAEHQVALWLRGDEHLASRELWQLADSLDARGVRLCPDPAALERRGESVSLVLPRLARYLGGVWCDLRAGDAEPAQGDAALRRIVNLLRGLAVDATLILDGGGASVRAGEACAAVHGMLREPATVLTAYKGDKRAPRYATSPHSPDSGA